MHAQDDEAETHFWTRMLRGSLVRVAGTPETLLPWLADEVDQAEIRTPLVFTDSTLVRLNRALLSRLEKRYQWALQCRRSCREHYMCSCSLLETCVSL